MLVLSIVKGCAVNEEHTLINQKLLAVITVNTRQLKKTANSFAAKQLKLRPDLKKHTPLITDVSAQF